MKPPILKKKRERKKVHNNTITDYYSWVHQKNILEVLSSPTKLDKDIRHYLNQENKYTDFFFQIQKNSKKSYLMKLREELNLLISR